MGRDPRALALPDVRQEELIPDDRRLEISVLGERVAIFVESVPVEPPIDKDVTVEKRERVRSENDVQLDRLPSEREPLDHVDR